MRGQLPPQVRAQQTAVLTGGKIPAEINKSRLTGVGKINPKATRPGMLAPTGPQPFISKGRIANPDAELPGPLSDTDLKNHATSSAGSMGVSFSKIDDKSSGGYQSQLGFHRENFERNKTLSKSFLTTTSVDSMQDNQFTSGNESELIGRGHLHVNDSSMMQHSLVKDKSGAYSLSSRKWMPPVKDQPGGWGQPGEKATFKRFDDAFDTLVKRGKTLSTDFSDL